MNGLRGQLPDAPRVSLPSTAMGNFMTELWQVLEGVMVCVLMKHRSFTLAKTYMGSRGNTLL